MYIEKEIDKQWLLNRVSDEEIFEHYIGSVIHEKVFNSPLRLDNSPSASIYYSKSGQLRFKDFGTGDNFTAISFVQEMFDLSFSEALKKIATDFGLINDGFSAQIVKSSSIIDKRKKKNLIQFQKKPFTKADLEYWNSYGISENTLKFFDVHSVTAYWLNRTRMPLGKNELCFCYYFPKTTHCKIYKPLKKVKKEKWLSNVNNDEDIQGYWQCDIKNKKPELLILTSSLKEVMLLYEFGIPAMAIHGENSNFNSDFIRHLKKYCKNIKSLYDNDSAGLKAMNNLKELYSIEQIIMPQFECETLKVKDLSDAYKYCDKTKVVEFINSLKS